MPPTTSAPPTPSPTTPYRPRSCAVCRSPLNCVYMPALVLSESAECAEIISAVPTPRPTTPLITSASPTGSFHHTFPSGLGGGGGAASLWSEASGGGSCASCLAGL